MVDQRVVVVTCGAVCFSGCGTSLCSDLAQHTRMPAKVCYPKMSLSPGLKPRCEH